MSKFLEFNSKSGPMMINLDTVKAIINEGGHAIVVYSDGSEYRSITDTYQTVLDKIIMFYDIVTLETWESYKNGKRPV